MRHLILGTAGHIDHGKTTLVKALTGTDTDRLPEEKARGITIDLGFAHLQLEDLDVGIVDVPGHEGLIRNMLAGATGFDAVLLVIAADEGVMPQTREHIAIARMLGVQRIVVAITKCDLVENEWLELVTADAQSLVAGISPDAPIVGVSAVTGAGLDELRAALVSELRHATQRRDRDVFRMPVDRVFTVRGTGTVVTGTVWSGRLAQHDTAVLEPSGRSVRIRAIQTHGASVDSAGAGERSAFALVGVDRDEVQRGESLVAGCEWPRASQITARIELLEGVALKMRQRVRVHLGTAEVMARVVLFDDRWVQLRMEAPVIGRAGDRFVLRSYSPVQTIGGGMVAEVARLRKRLSPEERTQLQIILNGDVADRIRAVVALAGDAGAAIRELPISCGASETDVPSDVALAGDRLFDPRVLNEAEQRLIRRVKRHHDAHPLERGMERAELLAELKPVLANAALSKAQSDGALATAGSIVSLPGFEPGFSPKQKVLRDQLLSTLREAGLAPPSVPELTAALRSNEVRAVLRLLEAEGVVTAVSFDLYMDTNILGRAIRAVRAAANDHALAAADFKTALPVSRKYLIPILEYLDRSGVTRREGDLRWVVREGTPENA